MGSLYTIYMRHCPHFLLAQNRKIISIVSQASQSSPHHRQPVKRSGQTRTEQTWPRPGLVWLDLAWLGLSVRAQQQQQRQQRATCPVCD